MEVLVREYRESDYDSVNKIIIDSWSDSKSKISCDYCHEFVSEINGEIVGYFYLLEAPDIIRNLNVYYIHYFCVDTSHRGMGIGRVMVDFIEKYAKKNGVKRLELTSKNERVIAHKLYLSFGFEKRDTSVFRKEII